MRKQTKTLLHAVSQLLSMAVSVGGYFLLVYILSFMTLVSPLAWLILQGALSMAYVIYQIMPVSSRVTSWIESQVTSAYMWYKYRPRTSGDQTIYQAIIIN